MEESSSIKSASGSVPQSPTALALWGGAECTINRIGDSYRDQLLLSGHHRREDDLDKFASLGLTALRYPLLWEAIAQAADPEALWAQHDARLERLRSLGVRPIIGLVHHGSGPPNTDLLAKDFAKGVAAHAAVAARRYPWARDWTPVNEPLTTARFAGLYGHWYPHRNEEQAFWLALLNQIDAIQMAMAAIREAIPGARLVQTEDLGHTDATSFREGQAHFDNERRWASWDLLAGQLFPKSPMWKRMVGMGFEERLQTIAARNCAPGILGLNHYLTSDRFLDHRVILYPSACRGTSAYGPTADVESVRVLDQSPGLEGAIRACWARYRIPIALTEVHNGCTREEQMRWIYEAWECAGRLRKEGVAIEAVTAWSLLGAHDWDSLLTRDTGQYESGVFDIRGGLPRETALAPLIRRLAAGDAPEHPVLARRGWWRKHAPAVFSARRPLLITGATGTLGKAFAGACDLRGIDYVLSKRGTLDLRDAASMERALTLYEPWAVINCAGWARIDEAETSPDDCFAVNYDGSVALANACFRHEVHYTGFSSDLVFDGLTGRAYVESDETSPLNVYGHSKARADSLILSSGARALLVRTPSCFSPYDVQNFAMQVVASLRSGVPVYAADNCIASPTYLPDLVRATLDLVVDDEKGLWHLASQGSVSWAGFATEIADALSLQVELIKPRPAAEMNWKALRPLYAPMMSERGSILPSRGDAVDRFAATVESF